MAHFIKLTQSSINGEIVEDNPILFNLDTVISVEPVGDKSVIQTRWGRRVWKGRVLESTS